MTRILPCSCQHSFQDERYGKGSRVHNSLPPKSKGSAGGNEYRCTVCSTTKERK